MISPSQDYHHAVHRTSDDVLRQQISHHLLEINTKVRALMDKAPSNNENMETLEKEVAALKKENLALEKQIASAETWEHRVLERDQKITQLKNDVNAAEKNLEEITESFQENEQEVKEQSRREGIDAGIKLCQERIFAMEAEQQFLVSLSKEWHDAYRLSTLSLMDFNSYMKFYFHGRFDAGCVQYKVTGGKGPFDRTQAMVVLGAPITFQGDPKPKSDPHFWVPSAQHTMRKLAVSDLKWLQPDAQPLCPPNHSLPELPSFLLEDTPSGEGPSGMKEN